jgi:hypothetical protein
VAQRTAEVDGFIDQAISAAGQQGSELVWRTPNHALYTGWPQTVTLPTKLDPAYEYSVIAFCDSLCRAIDFELIANANKTYPSMRGMISYQPSARSARLDAIKPEWSWLAATSVKVTMTDCTGAANVPCQWGLVVLRKPLQSAPVKPATPVDPRADAIQRALKLVREAAAKIGLLDAGYSYGALNSGERTRADLGVFDTGYEYMVFAFCESCTAINFDLVALSVAPIPAVETNPGITYIRAATVKPTSRQIYYADLHMSGCTANPCSYGIWVSRAAGSLPTQVTPSAPSVPVGTPSVPGGLLQLRVDPDYTCSCYRLRVTGQLQNARGRQAQVAVQFSFWNGTSLQGVPGNPQQRNYVLNNGTAGSYLDFNVASDPFDLGVLSLQMPYSALMLTSRPGMPYAMKAGVFLYMDNVLISRSNDVDFQFLR